MKSLLQYFMEGFETLPSGKRPDSIKHYIFSASKNKKFLITAPHGAAFSNNIRTMLKNIENVDVADSKSYRSYDPDSEIVAKLLGKLLDAEVLTLSNATHDHNKIVDNFYMRYVNEIRPKYLIEIHTHEMKHISSTSVEVSSGKDNNALSTKFAEALEKAFHKNGFADINVNGDYGTLFYKASKTASVNGEGWGNRKGNTLHVELPQAICNSGNTVKLAKILHDAIKAVL